MSYLSSVSLSFSFFRLEFVFFSDIDTGDKIYDKYYGIKNILKVKITIVIYIII